MADKGATSLTAENTFGTPVKLVNGDTALVSISGTWSATIYLQHSTDDAVTWRDVKSYTANVEELYEAATTSVLVRLGIKTGGYSSGTAVVLVKP